MRDQADALAVLAGFGIQKSDIEELKERVKVRTPQAKL